MFFNTIGHRKGIACFVPEHFQLLRNVHHEKYQISTIYSNSLAITNVYRSTNAPTEFITSLIDCITLINTTHIIMGDFNFCLREENNHSIKKKIEELSFKLIPSILHQPPDASHIMGRCIDHAYIKIADDSPIEIVSYIMKTCVYSDHEIQCVVLKSKNNLLLSQPGSPNHPTPGASKVNTDTIPYHDIAKWLESEFSSGRLKGDYKLCYTINDDLKTLFEEYKEECNFVLPDAVQDSFLFTECESANIFLNEWRQKRGFKRIGIICYENVSHIMTSYNYSAQLHMEQRQYDDTEYSCF